MSFLDKFRSNRALAKPDLSKVEKIEKPGMTGDVITEETFGKPTDTTLHRLRVDFTQKLIEFINWNYLENRDRSDPHDMLITMPKTTERYLVAMLDALKALAAYTSGKEAKRDFKAIKQTLNEKGVDLNEVAKMTVNLPSEAGNLLNSGKGRLLKGGR
jgi:hypothetical protein